MEYYETLQVEKTATQQEIKQAYKRLAKIHHPDKGGDKILFQKIQTAYETLSDEDKRRQYDNPMSDMFEGGGGGGFPFPFPFGFGGGAQGGGGVQKKADHHYTLKITLYNVYFGLKKTLNIKHEIKCEKCNTKCSTCNGKGKVVQHINMGIMQVIQEQPCHHCNGFGIVKSGKDCDMCVNKGIIIKENIIEIQVPRGVENKERFVYKGLGEQKKNDTEINGDFIVTVEIDEGVLFKRNGLDLIFEPVITFKESVIGKIIKVPHFEKELEVNTRNLGIINPTKMYPINKKGLVRDNGRTGNLYIKFNIEYSDKLLTEDQIRVLKDVL